MSTMSRIRIYHAVLAVLALLSFLTGELGLIHAWLGYGVSLVVVLRLLWALGGERQLGLMRFYPSFLGMNVTNMLTHPAVSRTLILGIALCLVVVSATGVIIDKGEALGLANTQVVAAANADDDEDRNEARHEEEEGFWGEVHEASGNLMIFLVGAHVGYLLLFRLPLARFMLFFPKTPR